MDRKNKVKNAKKQIGMFETKPNCDDVFFVMKEFHNAPFKVDLTTEKADLKMEGLKKKDKNKK